MKKLIFYIVNVFTEKRYSGNQLAVFTSDEVLTDEQMSKISEEINFSETCFIYPFKNDRKNIYNLRIFTPKLEIPFAGHPVLGGAFIIQQEILKEMVDEIILNLKVGQISVRFTYLNDQLDILWMKQPNPTFGRTIKPDLVSEVLSLESSELDENFPIQEVSTGLPFIIVPVKSLNSVEGIELNNQKYYKFIKDLQAKSILVFTQQTHKKENHLNVRVFAEYYGIAEDPATGSANGCLAGYLIKHRYFGKSYIDLLRVEQGFCIGRPSLIYISAKETPKEIDVRIGGKVVMVAEGRFV